LQHSLLQLWQKVDVTLVAAYDGHRALLLHLLLSG
jgi:hypothetical protein